MHARSKINVLLVSSVLIVLHAHLDVCGITTIIFFKVGQIFLLKPNAVNFRKRVPKQRYFRILIPTPGL